MYILWVYNLIYKSLSFIKEECITQLTVFDVESEIKFDKKIQRSGVGFIVESKWGSQRLLSIYEKF